MEALRHMFPLAPPALFEAVESRDLNTLVAFWARLAPEIQSEADLFPELKDSMDLTYLALEAIGEDMMDREQRNASESRALSVGFEQRFNALLLVDEALNALGEEMMSEEQKVATQQREKELRGRDEYGC